MSGNQGRKRRKHKMLQQSNRCCFCKRRLTRETATFEHVVPKSHGGGFVDENLKLSCYNCNQERGDQDYEQFREKKRPARE